jgi:heat shock protein HspQ
MCWTPLYANKHKIQDVIPLQTTGDKDQCFYAEFVTDITTDLQAYKTGEI